MRPQRRGSDVQDFRVPHGFVSEEKLSTVSFNAGFLFLGLVDAAQMSNSGGWLTLERVADVGRRLKNLKRYLKELSDAALIKWDPGQSKYIIVDGDKWRTSARNVSPEPAQNQPRTHSELDQNSIRTGPELHPIRPTTSPQLRNGSAGQSHVDKGPRAQGYARSPAQPRASAFPGPSSSRTDGPENAGRDAPRSGGGAARHVRKTDEIRAPWDPPEGDRVAEADAKADIRATIEKAQANNPNSTGRNAKFSKYDPDRPITPITSAMVWKANEE